MGQHQPACSRGELLSKHLVTMRELTELESQNAALRACLETLEQQEQAQKRAEERGGVAQKLAEAATDAEAEECEAEGGLLEAEDGDEEDVEVSYWAIAHKHTLACIRNAHARAVNHELQRRLNELRRATTDTTQPRPSPSSSSSSVLQQTSPRLAKKPITQLLHLKHAQQLRKVASANDILDAARKVAQAASPRTTTSLFVSASQAGVRGTKRGRCRFEEEDILLDLKEQQDLKVQKTENCAEVFEADLVLGNKENLLDGRSSHDWRFAEGGPFSFIREAIREAVTAVELQQQQQSAGAVPGSCASCVALNVSTPPRTFP